MNLKYRYASYLCNFWSLFTHNIVIKNTVYDKITSNYKLIIRPLKDVIR